MTEQEYLEQLRDRIATMAMGVIMEADGIQFASRYKEHAEMAYAQADAMIAERSKP